MPKKIKDNKHCHTCGEFCPGGLIDDKWCSVCQPKCHHCWLIDVDTPGSLVTGRLWNEGRRKWIVFKGYLCEQHAAELRGRRWL